MRASILFALAGAVVGVALPLQAQKPVRVLVYHDMEGLAGQNRQETFRYNHREEYKVGQKYLVADLNAVIAGLFDGGATKVDVVDAHGSGNPEPDVLTAELDPRAKQVFRDKSFRQYVDVVAPDQYDAIVAVGMHAKTGSRGFASHTYTIGMEILIEGKTITESELVGYSWGRVGVPLVMVTGDDRLKADLAGLPWLEYVVTKRATAADSVVLRPVAEVHAEMRATAKRAIEGRARAKPMTLPSPLKAALRAVHPASLAILEGVPGVNYHDNMVEFTAKDFGAAYDGVIALINVARQAYSDLYRDMFARRGEAEAAKLGLEFSDLLIQRWMDVESGRYKPPAPRPPAAGRRHHGAN